MIIALGESVIATRGLACYLAGFVIGNLRATGRLLTTRLVGLVAVIVAAVAGGATLRPRPTVLLVTLAVAAVAVAERKHGRRTTVTPAPPGLRSQPLLCAAHELGHDGPSSAGEAFRT